MRILQKQVADTEAEIGEQLLPVLAELLPIVRDLVKDLGTQLVAAVKAVDWKALTTDLMNTLSFFIKNATAIAQLTVAIFAVNTAYKTFAVVTGIATVAMDLYKYAVAKAAAGSAIATTSINLMSSAMRLIPWVAVVAGIALVATEIANSGPKFDSYKKAYEDLGTSAANITPEMSAFAATALDIQAKFLPVVALVKNLAEFMGLIPKNIETTINVKTNFVNQNARQVASSFGGSAFDAKKDQFNMEQLLKEPPPGPSGATKPTQSPLQQIIADSKQNAKVIQKQSVLERKGLSKEVAQWVTTSNKPVKAANEAIARITKNGNKAIGNLTKAYTNSAAGQAAAAAASASEITESFTAAYDDTADREAAALAERERVFKSFADSVKATFAGMKNGIINAFDLTELGGSSNAITRNMDKLLVRLRAFADNVKNLATMGLNPALLQQVISAGPMGGARLAEALVMGGAGGLSALNAGYSEFGALSSQIAQTGTESLFNQAGQQSIYNINVDGGVGSGSTIGKAIVDAIKAYERTSGAVWQGA
jgi:hypothetical protein